ncbi:MAG TPA: thymidylate synthase [Candidatus Angelobacter sp.]|nr:thymidylate synthase [Candidatus Angelobacter sp.]
MASMTLPDISGGLHFEPLYLADKIRIVNPAGRFAVVTLWSKADVVQMMLEEAGIDFAHATSQIAVIANLYGDGLPQMLANLLYNPQIHSLVLLGKNLSDSRDALVNFFARGITDLDLKYNTITIQGTTRRLPALLLPELFPQKPRVLDLGEDLRAWDRGALKAFLQSGDSTSAGERISITLPEMKVDTKPSDPVAQDVAADTPCETWREAIFVLSEFGRKNSVDTAQGDRRELLNLRAVIRDPRPESSETLKEYGLDLAELERYQEKFLDPVCPPDIDYTYGSRLRSHFGLDTLEECARILKDERGSRHAYVALWDTRIDLSGEEVPCLASLFFRVYDDRLTLTATFRAHNAATAWIMNCYGLIRLLQQVAAATEIPIGPLVMISESISLRMSEMQKVLSVIDKYKKGYKHYREDPNGHFEITLDEGRIKVVQRFQGMTVNRFEGATSQAIEHELGKARAISEISHAMYVGRELQRAERCLKTGEPFLQS